MNWRIFMVEAREDNNALFVCASHPIQSFVHATMCVCAGNARKESFREQTSVPSVENKSLIW